MKYLRVKFDNELWDIPLSVIAENRARYYANLDVPGKTENNWEWKKVFKSEYDMVMNDAANATNWASGNMDWADVKDYAERVGKVEHDEYGDLWVNAEKFIVEK